MENKKNEEKPIIFIIANKIINNSCSVQGNPQNIINSSHLKLEDIYQGSNSSEMQYLKKENNYLKAQVDFLTKQLEMTQNLLNKALTK